LSFGEKKPREFEKAHEKKVVVDWGGGERFSEKPKKRQSARKGKNFKMKWYLSKHRGGIKKREKRYQPGDESAEKMGKSRVKNSLDTTKINEQGFG